VLAPPPRALTAGTAFAGAGEGRAGTRCPADGATADAGSRAGLVPELGVPPMAQRLTLGPGRASSRCANDHKGACAAACGRSAESVSQVRERPVAPCGRQGRPVDARLCQQVRRQARPVHGPATAWPPPHGAAARCRAWPATTSGKWSWISDMRIYVQRVLNVCEAVTDLCRLLPQVKCLTL
jgi:hypothetical protein